MEIKTFQEYSIDGKRLTREYQMLHNIKHGFSRWFHKNGNIELETYYKNGVPNGLEKEWNFDGSIHEVLTYNKTELHGVNIEFEYSWIYTKISFKPL